MVVPGTSIMGLMVLAAATGSQLEIRARGREAQAALAALVALVERGFDED
jgi:phosphocarrier protein HPr